jgi:hypothetical protein
MKTTWKLINEFSYSSKKKETSINCMNSNVSNIPLTNKSDILNEFNNYYINVGKNISGEIIISNYNKLNWNELNTNCQINDFIYLDPIYPFKISNFVQKIPENFSYFINDLSNSILKKTADTISIPLSIIFNFSMVSGKYPSTYKDTIILPLFKLGDKKLCSNYRSIALTLTISKIFEKCIKKRLINFLNKNLFFSLNQYGFRPIYFVKYLNRESIS